jgi:hypothetical protein
VCSILFSRNFLGASPVRITSVCATILRGIVRPCRWREFVEPATAKKTVETAEVNIEPWRNSEWRRVASVFLGSELSPPVEDIPTEPPRDEPAPTTNVEKLSRAIKDNFTRAMAPHNYQARWQKWYDVLRVYFPAPQNPQLEFGNFYFSVLNSIGFAGLASAYISHCHVGWLVWLTCILTIAVAHISFITSFSQQQHPDSSGDQLAAEILKTIKSRDQK